MNRKIIVTYLFWMSSTTTCYNGQRNISSSQSYINADEKPVQQLNIPLQSQQHNDLKFKYNPQSIQNHPKIAFAPTSNSQHQPKLQNFHRNAYEPHYYSNLASESSDQYSNVEQLPEPIIAYDHHPNVKQYSSPLQPQFQLTAHQKDRLQRLISPEKYSTPHDFNPSGLPIVITDGQSVLKSSDIVTHENINLLPSVYQYHGAVNSKPSKIQGNPFVQYQTGVQSPTADLVVAQQKIIDPASILIHTTKRLKNIDPQFFQPQVFYDPVVPQHQLYLPKVFKTSKIIETPYDRQLKSHYSVDNSSKKNNRGKSSEGGDEDNEKNHDPDSFEQGYHKAAYGFPAYNQDDDKIDISGVFQPESYSTPDIQSEYNSASYEEEALSGESEPDTSKEKINDYTKYSDKDNYYNDKKNFNPTPQFSKKNEIKNTLTPQKQETSQADDYELEYDASTFEAPKNQKKMRRIKKRPTTSIVQYGFKPVLSIAEDAASNASNREATTAKLREQKGLKKTQTQNFSVTKMKNSEVV